MDAVVIDYGIVNLKNIMRGLEYVGARVTESADPDQVQKANRVILPGVGAFAAGMEELCALGMDDALKSVAGAGRPILGICLGMQMLLGVSKEYGRHDGLDLIPGTVTPIPNGIEEGGKKKRKVPHIGWSALNYPSHRSTWDGSCLAATLPGTFFYFIHSFMAIPDNPEYVLGHCVYEELPVVGAIKRDNVIGLQFHPERSGPAGLSILRRFIAT
jgi:glutamine amidotransferase